MKSRRLKRPDLLRAGQKIVAVSVAEGMESHLLAEQLADALRNKLWKFDPTISVEQARHQRERLLSPSHENACFELTIGLLQDAKRFGPTKSDRLDAWIEGFISGWHVGRAPAPPRTPINDADGESPWTEE
jgi:hypothetical protein